MKVLGVIPARYKSTRLPGKPLRELKGKTLVQRVYENAAKCRLIDDLVVATDDDRIVDNVRSFGGIAIMTDPELPSGTDRTARVAEFRECDIVVNIQGDEPFLEPHLIDKCIESLIQNEQCKVSTLARTGITEDELNNKDVVKTLINKNNEAIYFSRQNIPWVRDGSTMISNHPALKHIGLYVFRKSFLMKFISIPVSDLEKLEKLEQLRIIENGYKIYVETTDKDSLGIDTPADLKEAEGML